ncbi:hypothetical protein ABID23_001260 [Bartonella silvatica]|uniref:Uncharacterized protein n=1 Tax=Bartonella silvatica TaxID=357760 RepID=A0ABV2HHX2_9HYPH
MALIYTIHGRCCEMGLGVLRDVSLKQAHELANQWRAVLGEDKRLWNKGQCILNTVP